MRVASSCAAWTIARGSSVSCSDLASRFIVPPGRIRKLPSHALSADSAALIVPSPANSTTVSIPSRSRSGPAVNTPSSASHLALVVDPEPGLVMNQSLSIRIVTPEI